MQAQPGGATPATYTGAIFVERGDRLCSAQQTQGKLNPGEQRVGGKGKSREQCEGVLQYSSACAARLMRRLFGSLQQCYCIVAFANAALKTGEKEIN